MKKSTIVETIVVLYTILFLYTAISKWMDYSVFKEQVGASPILAPFAKWIAAGLPWVELFTTTLLIVPRWRLKGLYMASALMVSFTIYIIATLTFSKHIPCSCGGIIAQLSWKQHILFNTVFIILGFLGITLIRNLQKDQRGEWLSVQNVGINANPEGV